MKTYLILAILLITVARAFSGGKKINFGIEWCFGRKPSLDENQLRCLRYLDEHQIVKNGFADILRRRDKCPKCKEVIVDESKYISSYRYPFLVIDAGFVPRGTGSV